MTDAPWIAEQTRTLLAQKGHAWLLSGPSGLGQYSLALSLVRAWLCESAAQIPQEKGACGHCPSCHAIDVRTHADLCVLMPETTMMALGWPLSEKAQSEIDDKKRKPSKEIRVDALRDALEFSQRTSGRGKGKAVLVFPADCMNTVSANALLKTLEEPVGDVRFVLATEAVHQLLPTIRSRCQTHAMLWPSSDVALSWLQSQGLALEDAKLFLRAAGGRPEDALQYAQSGPEPATWRLLPKAVARGDVAPFKDMSGARVIDALQKVCHDLLALRCGSVPRFFEASELPDAGTVPALSNWSRELLEMRKTADHPFNPGLMLETLVSQAKIALHSKG